MEGLKVSEQEQYPIIERVCTQLAREMDPEIAHEVAHVMPVPDKDGNFPEGPPPKRVLGDPVYRWRIGRAVAQE
jgi:hypothetical protein